MSARARFKVASFVRRYIEVARGMIYGTVFKYGVFRIFAPPRRLNNVTLTRAEKWVKLQEMG